MEKIDLGRGKGRIIMGLGINGRGLEKKLWRFNR